MNSLVKNLKYIYRCCRLFILVQKSQLFTKNDSFICNATISRLLVISNIDSYFIFINSTRLYTTCCRSFLHRNRPKFGIFNGFPHIEYQSYPLVLANLSLAKEAAIARAYPVVPILKLRPSEVFNPAANSRIKGYAVLFLQNPALLLNLLFSPTQALHNIICIVWVGKRRLTDFNL